jgi:class 3 adenylate cyclase
VLAYFGATVNIASCLEHQCRGGEIILAGAVLTESAARDALAGRTVRADSVNLRGVSAPVGIVRVIPLAAGPVMGLPMPTVG